MIVNLGGFLELMKGPKKDETQNSEDLHDKEKLRCYFSGTIDKI